MVETIFPPNVPQCRTLPFTLHIELSIRRVFEPSESAFRTPRNITWLNFYGFFVQQASQQVHTAHSRRTKASRRRKAWIRMPLSLMSDNAMYSYPFQQSRAIHSMHTISLWNRWIFARFVAVASTLLFIFSDRFRYNLKWKMHEREWIRSESQS